MKFCFVLLLAVASLPSLSAAEKPLYQTGKIVDIQQKTKTRILYYQVDTPVTKEDPYYELSVQVKDTIYVVTTVRATRGMLCPKSGTCPKRRSGSGSIGIICILCVRPVRSYNL